MNEMTTTRTPEVIAAGSGILLLIGCAQPVQAEQFIMMMNNSFPSFFFCMETTGAF